MLSLSLTNQVWLQNINFSCIFQIIHLRHLLMLSSRVHLKHTSPSYTRYLVIAQSHSTRKSIAGRIWRVYPVSSAVRVHRLHPPSERFGVGGSRLSALLRSKACGCHGYHRIHREMLGHAFCISSR